MESKRVCELLVYLHEALGENVPAWVHKAARDCYGNKARIDEATKLLCARLRLLTEAEVERIVYDGHSDRARRLAGWWERHQEWDAKRVEEEEEERKLARIRKQARAKLTGEEIDALGI